MLMLQNPYPAKSLQTHYPAKNVRFGRGCKPRPAKKRQKVCKSQSGEIRQS